MTNESKRNAGRQYAMGSAESGPLRQAYTVNLHSTANGELHSLVARLDLTTRRYSFSVLPALGIPVNPSVPLHYGLHYVANLVELDAEMEWYHL